MNPLQIRLAALRRRLRLVVSLRGVCWLLAFLVGAAALAGGLDWLLRLPGVPRALLLVAGLCGAGFLAYRYLLQPLTAPADDLSLALKVEAKFPVLNDALASTIQFLELPADSETAGSPSLRREAVQQAVRMSKNCNFNEVVDARGTFRATLACLAGAALAVFFFLWYPAHARTALARLLDPFGEHDWPRQTELAVEFKELVPAGQPFVIHGSVSGVIPKFALVEFQGLSTAGDLKEIPIDEKTESFALPVDMTRQQGNFRFRVRANDAVSPGKRGQWHQVTVVQPAELTNLSVRLVYPKYTDLPAEELPGGYESINEPIVLGTRVQVKGITDQRIGRAWIEVVPSDPLPLYVAASPVGLAANDSLPAVGLLAAMGSLWDKVPARLDGSGTKFAVEFLPRVSGTYHLHWEDTRGVGQKRSFLIRVKPDRAPEVKLECLSLVRESNTITANALLSLKVTADDPEYAVKSMLLEYRRKDREGRDLDPGWHRLPLYDHETAGAVLPAVVFSGLSGLPVIQDRALRLRPKHLEMVRPFPIAGLVEEGQVLILRASADDFDDVTLGKEPGHSSPPLELRVASPEEFKAVVQNAMRQVRDDLTVLNQKQEKALKMVAQAQEQLRQTGKLRPEDVKQLLDAREEQKKIQDRVGKDTREMLQKDVDRIRRALEDNALPRSTANDKMDNVARSLRRLAEDQLPKVQDLVDKVLKDEEDPANKQRPREQRAQDLNEARRQQEESQKTLEGLLTDLSPFVTVQEMQGRTRELAREQKELRQEMDKLAEKEERLRDKFPRKEEREQMDADRRKLADQQKRLAERAQQLLNEMREVRQERRESNPALAEKLDNAVKEGAERREVARQMRQAANDIRDRRDNAAQKNQRESEKTLERMAGALEERREEELDRLTRKQQEEQDRLDKLREDMDKLRKKVQEAKEIKNKEQREAALKKLAAEQRQLQDKVDQMVRRLSRLRADEAVQELRRASRRMEEAGRQLDNGEDPQKKQEEALDRLNEADKKLEKANDRVENELARLKQAKIADEIKRLKTRQDAAVKEMERIHQEMQREKRWPVELRRSLADLKNNRQLGLAADTEAIGKKLAEAHVFAHILDKARQAMVRAADRMAERLQAANDTDARQLTPEELAAEKKAQDEILRLQRDASKRLERLIESLKNETGGVRPPPEPGKEPQPGAQGDDQGGGPPPPNQDGIPSLAQQKALRAEQQDVNDRTKDFDKRHPELENLSDEDKLTRVKGKDKMELEEIHADQKKVRELADELFRAPKKEGE